MSTISYLASLVNQVIGRQNAIESNAKKVDELPHQTTLEPTSKLPVSRLGVSEHITVQQIISSIQNSNYNKLLSVGAIDVEGTDIIVERGVSAQINGLLYSTSTDTIIPITLCASGFNRKDILVLTTSNTIIAISGEETDGAIVIAPTTPTTDAIYITEFDVSDSAIGTPIDPILGNYFKKKTENLDYSYPILKGTRAVIQLRPEGHSYYYLESSLLVSVDGFGLSLITGNPDAEMPYPMKDLFIHNTGTTPFTLLHNGTGSATSKFFFLDETDLVVPPGGKVWLKYGGTYCQLFLTSWTEQSIPTFQQITQSGNTTEDAIETGGFVTRDSANVWQITFNDGNLNKVANLRSEATIDNVVTYTLPNENGTVALREWVYDKFASKENLLQYNYDFSEPIDSIRLELPPTESYLIIDSLINSIQGFNVSFSDLFEGKDYFIYNNSSDEITLKHNSSNDIYDFNFKAGVNIQLPRRGVIHLKFIGGKFIDVNKSWEYFNELQGVNINNAAFGEVLTYNSSSQLWENKKVYNDLQIRRNGITIFDDMIAITASDYFQKLTFNSGGWSVSTLSNENNPGVIAITSSVTSASSGGSIIPSSTGSPRNYAVGVGMQYDLIMRTNALSENVIIRFGIVAGTTNATQPANGVYLRLNNSELVGQTASGSVRSQTSAYNGITEATWYHFRVKMVSESLSVYELYDMDGTLLWTDNLSTNLPSIGEGVQPTFIAYNQIAEARQICQVDYISFTYPPMNRGALI